MPQPICPYLGLPDDPDTALEFPSTGNHCYHARPLEPVKTGYQRTMCLTGQHTACPVYVRAGLAPLPRSISAAGAAAGIPAVFKLAGIAALLLIVLGALFFLGGFGRTLAMLGISTDGIPISGGGDPTPFQPLGSFTPTDPGDQAALLIEITSSPLPTRAACPPPAGWSSYVVNPTDSVTLLSLLYNIPPEELRRANCLGEEDYLHPGEVIYIPFAPTATPTLGLVGIAPLPQISPLPIVPTLPFFGGGSTNRPTATATRPIPTTGPGLPTSTRFPTSTILPSATFVLPTFAIPTITPPVLPTSIFPTWTVRPTSTTQPPPTATRRPTNTPQPTRTPRPTNTPQIDPTDPPPPTATQPPPPTATDVPPPTATDPPPPPTATDPPPPTATDPPPPTATDPPPAPTATDPPPEPTATAPPPEPTTPPPTDPPPEPTDPPPPTEAPTAPPDEEPTAPPDEEPTASPLPPDPTFTTEETAEEPSTVTPK